MKVPKPRNRKRRLATPVLFKLEQGVEKFLRSESERTHKPMVTIVEEALRFRASCSVWPPAR